MGGVGGRAKGSSREAPEGQRQRRGGGRIRSGTTKLDRPPSPPKACQSAATQSAARSARRTAAAASQDHLPNRSGGKSNGGW
eukprot:3936650-Pyramimonas_sp.AAC.1